MPIAQPRNHPLKLTYTTLLVTCIALCFVSVQPALCWSNGGYSADISNPDYGTHDWIAQHALDLLPAEEKQYLADNLASYLYGTELPDNGEAADGIGDTTKHHIYYAANGAVSDDVAADRAQAMYDSALAYLKAGNKAEAAKAAGAMTHYIADVAAFGHVMGKSTAWGEEAHHSDYEDHVDDNTGNYGSSFKTYLSYDGNLSSLSAYNATLNVAYDTTFGGNSGEDCRWMDSNYDWSSTAFSNSCGESLNFAVNTVADVLHTLYLEAYPPTSTTAPVTLPSETPTPTVPEFPAISLLGLIMITMTGALVYKRAKIEKTR